MGFDRFQMIHFPNLECRTKIKNIKKKKIFCCARIIFRTQFNKKDNKQNEIAFCEIFF